MLEPRADFLNPPRPFQKEDVYPWRYNRALSYLRRPLLLRVRGDVTDVLWGPRQVYSCHVNLVGLCMTGRLRAKSSAMKEFIGRLLNRQGESFNDEVAEVLSRDTRLIVRPRLKKIPALRGQLEQHGDIDVFVIDRGMAAVYVLECKDLEGARTPFEMGNELTAFFKGTKHRRSYLAKHLDRVRWVHANLDVVLALFEIPRKGRCKVGSLIVIDRELFTPFLRQSPVPITPLESFRVVPPERMAEFLKAHAAFC